MKRRTFLTLAAAAPTAARLDARGRTEVAIRGDGFLLNGRPTYAGRSWNGMKIEGLLLNARMVQGIFDDLNPATRARWAYPDTGKWDPERNTREFLAAMPDWRSHGLLSFTINLQGGSPEGYSKGQPWENSALDPRGELRPAYARRLERILDSADGLGMVAILGCYYFGQDERLADEAAVRRGVAGTVDWILEHGWRNVLLEIANECDVKSYDHEILKPGRIHELIELAKGRRKNGARVLAGTSFGGGSVPTSNVVKASDFLLLHGNGPDDPARIARMIASTRQVDGYRPMPVLINEDDHFRFEDSRNHFTEALRAYVSWGFFDPGRSDYVEGYQCPPVNWSINTPRKKAFFAKLAEVAGAEVAGAARSAK